MIFTYPHKTNIPEFHADDVIAKIIERGRKVLASYEFTNSYTISIEPYKTTDIFPSSIHSVITFKWDITDKNDSESKLQLLVPDIKDGFVVVKGVKRFLQQQIRDILFVPNQKFNSKYLKILPDLNFFITFSQCEYKYNYSHVNIWDLLDIIGDEKDIEYVATHIPEGYLAKFEDSLKVKSRISKSSRHIVEIIRQLFDVSDVFLELYNHNVGKFIVDTLKFLDSENYPKTLHLKTRRIRTIDELVYSALMTQFIDLVLKAKFSNSKKLYQSVIEPFAGLFEFTIVETVFDSPFAGLSDKFRLTLGGPGGFDANVPAGIRNLHDTHFQNIDCVATPDRERCGVVLFSCYGAETDNIGRFKVVELNKDNKTEEE